MGLLLSTLIISGLLLHALLFTETQLNEVVLTKFDKNKDPIKKHFFNEPKHFILYYFFSLNTCECLKYYRLQ